MPGGWILQRAACNPVQTASLALDWGKHKLPAQLPVDARGHLRCAAGDLRRGRIVAATRGMRELLAQVDACRGSAEFRPQRADRRLDVERGLPASRRMRAALGGLPDEATATTRSAR